MSNNPIIVNFIHDLENNAVELQAAVTGYERLLERIEQIDDPGSRSILRALMFGNPAFPEESFPSGESLVVWSLGLTKLRKSLNKPGNIEGV